MVFLCPFRDMPGYITTRPRPVPFKLFPAACFLLHAGFLLGLFFDPEDGGDMFL
jgi:hypothetical protein